MWTTVQEVPDLMDFRDFVDNRVHRKRDEILIKMAYLTAARVSEITTKVTPWLEQHNKSKPYGLWMKTNLPELYDFKHTVFKDGEPRLRTEKVLIITMACAKRKRRGSKKDPDRKVYKVIALPTTQAYEPWTIDLLKWWNVTRKLSFDITGARLWQIVRENLGDLDPQIHPHSLRHYRLNHLVYEYGIDAYVELPFITGWTFGNVFGQGSRSSSAQMLDIYLHEAWKKYFPKLLKPMSYHAIRPLELEKEPQVDQTLMKALQAVSGESIEEKIRRLKTERLAQAFLELARQDPAKASQLLGLPEKQTTGEASGNVDDIVEEEKYR